MPFAPLAVRELVQEANFDCSEEGIVSLQRAIFTTAISRSATHTQTPRPPTAPSSHGQLTRRAFFSRAAHRRIPTIPM